MILSLILAAALAAGFPGLGAHKDFQEFSDQQICSLCEDASGALWFNTTKELWRFNGNRVESLASGGVNSALCYDSADHIYLQKSGGLLKVNVRDASQVYIPYGRQNVRRSDVALYAEPGTLITIIGKEMFTLDGADSLRKVSDLRIRGHVVGICRRGGTLLIATSRGEICSLSEQGRTRTLYEHEGGLLKIFADSRGRLWAGCADKGFRILDSEYHEIPYTFCDDAPSPDKGIRTFAEDRAGNVYAGGPGGLYVTDGALRCREVELDARIGMAVCSVFCDSGGGIWAGTFYDGVFYRSGLEIPTVRIEHSAEGPISQVRSIAKDAAGRTYVFTDNFGAFEISGGSSGTAGLLRSEQHPRLIQGSSNIKFQSSFYDPESGSIWCGEYDGALLRLKRGGGFEKIPYVSAQGTVQRRITYCITRHGEDLLLGAAGGVYLFNPLKEKTISRRLKGFTKTTFSLCCTGDTLWIGSSGLYRYCFGSGECTCPFPEGSVLAERKCNSLSTYGEGGILAATQSYGLHLVANGKDSLSMDSSTCSLAHDDVFFSLELPSGEILCGTRSGLSMIDPLAMRCRNYGPEEIGGLSSMVKGAALRDEGSRVLVGGKNGVLSLDWGALDCEAPQYGFDFDCAAAGPDVLRQPGRSITLPYYRNNVRLFLSSTDLSHTADARMEYRTSGEWIPLQRGAEIFLSGLRPGEHCVSVRSCENPEVVKSLLIRITPPWYASVWAKILWALLGAGVVALVLSLAYSRVVLRERLRSEKNVRRERTKLFVDVSRKLRTPLTAVLGELDLFFEQHPERFSGRARIESSRRNAEKMKEIISEYVDLEKKAEEDSKPALSTPLPEGPSRLHSRKILVVENDADVLSLLKSALGASFEILEAGSGEEGFRVAVDALPDLVLCEVQIPGMDGTKLCAELRGNFSTRHIPVILLTDHASEQHNIEGLRSGADDFMAKPFNVGILRAKCENLIGNREMLRSKYRLSEESAGKAGKEADARFLDAAIGAVERNLRKEGLDVLRICEELSMSRTAFTVRLKQITGLTPGAFIEDIKLKEAARLLKETSMRVKEISDELLFSDPKYFTLRFKKKFGCTPKDYV